MHATALATLRTAALDGLATNLQQVAADWSKLVIDRLPMREHQLSSLQEQYLELWEALPICDADEVKPLLNQFVRGLRLHRTRLTMGQVRLLRELGLLPGAIGGPSARPIEGRLPDDAWSWLQPIRDGGCLIQHITLSSALYLVAHRSLSALRPRLMDEFRDALCRPEVQETLVNVEGELRLGALLDGHAAWLADLSRQRGAIERSSSR